MTRNEWTKLAYLASEWWNAPMSAESEEAWFGPLSGYDMQEVERAFHELLRDAPSFMPRLGEVIARLVPQQPSFDEAWAMIVPVLANATVLDKEDAARELVERAGPVVAGWVLRYGVKRMALEPTLDPQFGGAVLKRLADSYVEQVGSESGRRLALDTAQRAVGELERGEQKALPAGEPS